MIRPVLASGLLICGLVACTGIGVVSPGDPAERDSVARAVETGQISFTPVFDKREMGDTTGEDFANIRIPALAVSKGGTLLAFAEGRIVRSDHTRGPLVLRRSLDNGRTWLPLQVIARHGSDSLNNPTPVVLESGRILLVYQRFPEDYHSRALFWEGVDVVRPGLAGEGVQTNHLVYSDDDGETWSTPQDITARTKRTAPVVANFTGPGPGLVIQQGPHAGRIVLPSCDFTGEGSSRVFRSYATLSDDGGETWRVGQQAVNPTGESADETQLVELPGGELLMSVRHRGQRMLAYSSDGGETFTPLQLQADLPDSAAMGSVIRLDDPELGSVLLHTVSSTRINNRRSRGAIYLSADNGASWPAHRVYHAGSFDYSSIALLPDGAIGVLAEIDHGVDGPFTQIKLVRIDPGWLLEPLRKRENQR